jgi:DNA-binding XRE family transcriptional regulator
MFDPEDKTFDGETKSFDEYDLFQVKGDYTILEANEEETRRQWSQKLAQLKSLATSNNLQQVTKDKLQDVINELYPLALSVSQNIRNPQEFNQLLDFAELSIKAGQPQTNQIPQTNQSSNEIVVGIQELRREIVKLSERFRQPSTSETDTVVVSGGKKDPDIEEVNANLTVMGSLIYQAVREALSKNTFQKIDGTPWPTALLHKGSSRGQAQLRPAAIEDQPLLSPQEIERWSQIMWKQREELSDLDADALDLLSHTWLQQARTPGHYAIADIDQFLALRGLKPKQSGSNRRGGYEPEQRAEMLQALSHIQNLWLNMGEIEVFEERGKGRKQRTIKENVQSKAFVITDRMGQMSIDGYMDVRRFIFQPGHLFAHYLFGPGRQTALLSAKAVQYDPYRQKWEKRLARYLSWQWRSQARRGEYMRPYRVATLLEAVGEEINQRYPAKTRDRLEKALDALQKDEVITAWQYQRWDESVVEKRGWAESWKDATILIEPPEVIRDAYRSIEMSATEKILTGGSVTTKKSGSNASGMAFTDSPSDFAQRIREHRKELHLSQLQTAEQLEIAQSYLSKLERGQVEPSSDIKKRILTWLGAEAE